MTGTGWLVMGIAVLGMTGLLGWCVWKVFSTPGSTGHLHSTMDIDPEDD